MPSPLWSVVIPTFHCARFLRQTLESMLSQGPGPDVMQIEVIDDCSTQDDPESVVRAAAGERVHFCRQFDGRPPGRQWSGARTYAQDEPSVKNSTDQCPKDLNEIAYEQG